MTLRLTNNVTGRYKEFEVTGKIKGRYAYIDINLPKMDDGEYEYTLSDDTGIIGKGIAQIGEVKANKTEYNNEVKYKQYNG